MPIAALLFTACTITPTDAGSVAINWQEETGDPVGHGVLPSGSTLIRDDLAWAQWLAALPDDMHGARADDLNAVSLDDNVVVVAVWGRCTEESHVVHEGRGRLKFTVTASEPRTDCVWAPRRVEVWDVPLTTLDVEREQVTLQA